MTLVTSAPLLLSWAVRRWVVPRLEGHPVLLPLRTTTWAVLALGVLVFYRVSAYDFVYFRF
jgi:hypothetical protein